MEVKINGSEYNPVQLNETVNFSPDGKILSKSLMLNLRGEKPSEVWKSYRELKRLIEGKEGKPEKKARNNPEEEKKQNMRDQKKDENVCPECGGMLVEKSGISSKNGRPYHFWGCSSFPICSLTKPFLDKEVIPVADQNLITIEE